MRCDAMSVCAGSHQRVCCYVLLYAGVGVFTVYLYVCGVVVVYALNITFCHVFMFIKFCRVEIFFYISSPSACRSGVYNKDGLEVRL